MAKKISVIIPAFNEEKAIGNILKDIKKNPIWLFCSGSQFS